MTFERKENYLVLKGSDIDKALSDIGKDNLMSLALKVEDWRGKNGKAQLQCVVVEHDWPEYEPVWNMIESRITGKPAPGRDELAYDMARQIMQLFNETYIGGLPQMQARIQCFIEKELAQLPVPAPAPDWSQSERRDCVTCGSEGVSTLHYNGEPVCYSCWPTEPAPAPAPAPTSVSFYRDGIEAAATWVDESREAFERESGQVDPDTGTLEFRNNADAEYSSVLFDVAEGIRQLHPNAAQAPLKGWKLVPTVVTKAQSDAVAALYAPGFMDDRMIKDTYQAYLDGAGNV